jgi:hypothetical protein
LINSRQAGQGRGGVVGRVVKIIVKCKNAHPAVAGQAFP